MADTQTDQFEQQLEADIKTAQEALTAGQAQETLAEQKRWLLSQQLVGEFFGRDKTYTALVERFRNENFTLKQAINFAKEQNPNALGASELVTFLAPLDLDRNIGLWFDALKSKQQVSLEKFLFGEELKTEKTTIAEKHADIFQNPYDNWVLIANAYKEESKAREDTIDAYERAVIALAAQNGKEAILPSGPTPQQLADLEKQLADHQNRLNRYHEQYQRWLSRYREQGRTDDEAIPLAQQIAQRMILSAEEEQKPKEEAGPAAAGGERVVLPATRPRIEKKAQEAKEKRPTTKVAVITAEGEEIPIWTFRDALRHPFSFLEYQVGQARNYIGQLFGRGEKTAEKKIAEKAVTTGTKAVVTKAAPGVIAKLSGLIPSGITQVIAVLSFAKSALSTLFSKRVREALLGAGVGLMILLQTAVNFLISSAWVAGGAVIGFFVGGPVGAAIGAGVGYVVGPSIGSAISSLLSGGATTAGATATEIGTAATGGVTAVTSGVSGITAAVASGAAPIFIAFSVTVIGTLITIIATASAMVVATTPDDGSRAEGASFSISKTAAPTFVENGASSPVVYSVTITATNDLSGITVDDKFSRENANGSTPLSLNPEEPFPTSLTKGESRTIRFQAYTVTQADNNSNLVNVVTISAGGETLSAQATVTVGTPNYTASRCPVAPVGNACAPSEMAKYFGDNQAINDNASRICYKESSGNISDLNDACTKNLPPEKMREYSVGIFQINLWAHSELCLQVPDITENPFNKPYKKSCSYPDCTPCDRNQELLDKCAAYWMVPANNIRYAAQLSKGGTKWYPAWSTAAPQYCNIQ